MSDTENLKAWDTLRARAALAGILVDDRQSFGNCKRVAVHKGSGPVIRYLHTDGDGLLRIDPAAPSQDTAGRADWLKRCDSLASRFEQLAGSLLNS